MAEREDGELRKLQMVLLDILKMLDRFCEENGITYFLDSGTALGAVRHAGFIPWDDDVDVGMLREDYDRFIELAKEGLPEGYSLHQFDDTPGFAAMFAKIYKDGTVFETEESRSAGCPQCVFVDVFPYDALSSDKKERERQLACANKWQKISYLYHSAHVTIPSMPAAARAVVGAGCHVVHFGLHAGLKRESIRRKFDQARVFSASPSDELSVLSYTAWGPFDRELLTNLERRSFEGCMFPCPADFDCYLTTLYGPTWRELPPPEQRRTHKPLRLVLSAAEEG